MPDCPNMSAQGRGLLEEARVGTLLSNEAGRFGYKQFFTGLKIHKNEEEHKIAVYEQDLELADEMLLRYGGRNINLKNLREHYGSMPDFTWVPNDESKSHVSIEFKTCVSDKVTNEISVFHPRHEFDLLYDMAQGGLCALIIATWHVDGRDLFYYCKVEDKKPTTNDWYGDSYRIRLEKKHSYLLGFRSSFSLYDIFKRTLR